jgi:hypothetical protein
MNMIAQTRLLILLGAITLSACASTYSQTWKDPEATPLEFRGEKVVAVVLIKDPAQRRLAEDRLAQQIAARGAQGRTMYSMIPDATPGNEEATRAALEAQNVKGVIVMRPVNIDRKVHVTQSYQEPSYASFWGGYYGYGMSMSYSSPGSNEPRVSETTVVYVETLVYSLKQNKLVWGGQSKTTNPETLTELIQELAAAATSELVKEGLAKKP